MRFFTIVFLILLGCCLRYTILPLWSKPYKKRPVRKSRALRPSSDPVLTLVPRPAPRPTPRPAPIVATLKDACNDHVVFTTFKCPKCDGLRKTIEDNTAHVWSEMKGVTFRPLKNTKTNKHGVPILGSMYMEVMRQCPFAKTYTYVNGDIIGTSEFVHTINAVLHIGEFLMVGRRTNVKWDKKHSVKHMNYSFDSHFEKGALFQTDAQDYFTVTKRAIDWESIPPFVIGRPAYDNWLVNHIYHNPSVALIDATKTVRMVHQTDEDGNGAHGGRMVKSRADKQYNRILGKGQWDHGRTTHAQWETSYDATGKIVLLDRRTGKKKAKFQIHVLTMNRATSLKRLLDSLEKAKYNNDPIDLYIHVDQSNNNHDCISVAETFHFSHGSKTVEVAKANKGLRNAWFHVWTSPKEEERAIILEDDTELSPMWYEWLKRAWEAYGERTDVAGISLQRQTLIPKKPHRHMELVNNHEPFLYQLVGSIGFSPHPKQWLSFMDWLSAIDLETFDVSVKGLITTDWYRGLNKRHMWTQHFIYFCNQQNLFTLYVNLPSKQTLASHMREKGEHYGQTEGRDFSLATSVNMKFPNILVKYGWDGIKLRESSICWETYQKNLDITLSTTFVAGKSVMMGSPSVKILCELLTTNTRVLEWGSGGSTLFFSQFVKSWDTIEHNTDWISKMKTYTTRLLNVRVHGVKHSWNGVSNNGDGSYTDFKEYVDLPKTFKSPKFDIVLVDGRARVDCARSTLQNSLLSKNGVVIIHDWERKMYKEILDTFEIVTVDTVSPRQMVVLRPKKTSQQTIKSTYALVTDGTEYGGWTYDSSLLTADSIVYSVGLGEDTSWDEGIMKRFDLQVWGFDPTPKSKRYVESNIRLGKNFHYTPEGLSTKKTVLSFTKPKNPNHVSMRQGKHNGGETIQVPVNSLENWMERFGHTRIDILKIDIEGSEYEVLEDWIKRKWFPMNQLLIEFHQRFFKNKIRHNNVLNGLIENGFEIMYNKGGQEISLKRVEKKGTPLVLMALNMQLSKVARTMLPYMCSKNNRVIVLSNIAQSIRESCVEQVEVKAVASMPWSANYPEKQKIYFIRWYVLLDWMLMTNTKTVFTMDTDAVMLENVTKVASLVQGTEPLKLWVVYNPPRSSWPFALLNVKVLQDITTFWNKALLSDIWTSEFVKGAEPNDMVLLGHYTHSALQKPYPCWGYGPEHKEGSCDNSIAYAHTKVLKRLKAKNVKAKFRTETLSLNKHGEAPFRFGVVDNNYRHDPIKRYEMKNGEKQIRFTEGVPELKLRVGTWVKTWGYVLEDKLENCINHHLVHIENKDTCVCSDFCCNTCHTTVKHTKLKCPYGKIYVYGQNGELDMKDCFLNQTTTWDSLHSESQHSFNQYLWYASKQYPCATPNIDKADLFFVVIDFFSKACKSKMRSFVLNHKNWETRIQQHVVWLWDGADTSFGAGKAIQSANDELTGMVRRSVNKYGNVCNTVSSCYDIAAFWKNGLTTPYYYTNKIVETFKDRDKIAVGAWSTSRGSPSTRTLRKNLHTVLTTNTLMTWRDTSLTKENRDWHSNLVTEMYKNSVFCIVPKGDSPSSRRLSTCIVAGSLPVICSNDFVPPYPFLNWSAFSFHVPEEECQEFVQNLKYILQDKHVNVSHMQQNLAAVQNLFNTDPTGSNSKKIIDSLLKSVPMTLDRKAKLMQKKNGFVNVQFLNEGYIEMTKSWICNIRHFPSDILHKTLFITTDEKAYKALTVFDASLSVILEPYSTPKDLTYGQYAYYDFMLFRTKLLLRFLKNKITIWLTESDAVWLRDPTEVVVKTHGDMVTMSDNLPPVKLYQGGFQLLRPTKPTLDVWTKLVKMFKRKMEDTKKGTEMNDSGSEQLMLNSLVKQSSDLKLKWLNSEAFVSGQYYKHREKYNDPIVILNNWIKGNKAKVDRAKKYNHWYLNKFGKCKDT